MKRSLAMGIGAFLSVAMAAPLVAEACSRAVYFGKEGQTVTGRTMDWFVSDMDTNLWLYPRGLERSSNTKAPLIWKSKYGSVVTTIYEGAAADGMNEKGPGRQHALSRRVRVSGRRGRRQAAHAADLGVGAVCAGQLRHHRRGGRGSAQGGVPRRPDPAPTGEPGTVHLSISDASGDSAIFEYHRRQAA